MALRLYLTGRVTIESAGKFISQDAFPGKQGLLAFVRLAIDRGQAVSREDLAAMLWPGEPPRAWDTGLQSIMSKLRALLAEAGLEKSECLASAPGCYQLLLPIDAWVDIEAAFEAVHEAEGFLPVRDWRQAWAAAQVAYHITRRPFLAGESGLWVEQQRERLQTIFARA